jgi:hypothetical protein
MNINKDKLSDLENAFTRLKANNSDAAALRNIADALHSLTNKNFTVSTVSPTDKNETCYVMTVYPDESTIDLIIDSIVNEQNDEIVKRIWNSTGNWIVEIDTRILQEKIGLSEKELTALLMHEVGHVMYNDSIPQRICKVVRFEYARTSLSIKNILREKIFHKVLVFPVLHACLHTRDKSTLKNEARADKYAISSGYGDDLISAMDKIMIFAGTNENMDKDLKDLTLFSIDTVTQMQNRQNTAIRRNMQHMIANAPGKFAKDMVGKVGTLFDHNHNGGSMTEAVKDQFIYNKIDKLNQNLYDNLFSEGVFNRIHKMKKLDPADFDYIALEINNIKSNDDKMMIVSYIYSKLEMVEYYIQLIDSQNPHYYVPHSKDSLEQMRNRLLKYREAAINFKIPEIDYRVNIMYPAGFEG